MKICHITSMHGYNDARIFQRACQSLARDGYEVTQIATHNRQETLRNVKILPLKLRTGWKRRIFSSYEAFRIAFRLDADIFHFHDPELLPWMFLLSLKGRNVVYDIHENFVVRFYQWNLPSSLANIFSVLFRKFEKFCIARFKGIVVVSYSIGQLFKKEAKHISVVHNVVDVELMKTLNLSPPKHPHTDLVISGTSSDERNCRQAVMAMKYINKARPNVKLRFAGRYDPEGYDEELKDLGEESGVKDNLIFEGMVPLKDNFERIAKSHIGCVFYEDNSNTRVAVPNRIFEYMACGLPILAEDFFELRQIVTSSNCGVLVDSSSPKSIAEGTLKILENPERMRLMGQNARKTVMEKYNLYIEIQDMLRIYEEIVYE